MGCSGSKKKAAGSKKQSAHEEAVWVQQTTEKGLKVGPPANQGLMNQDETVKPAEAKTEVSIKAAVVLESASSLPSPQPKVEQLTSPADSANREPNSALLSPGKEISFEHLRACIIGIDSYIETLFGPRLLTYADYTASGRALTFIEDYVEQKILPMYANTHTDDAATGQFMTKMLHEAESTIKECVNAGIHDRVIACGTGSTGAINKFQQLLGVFLPPASRRLYEQHVKQFVGESEFAAFQKSLSESQPVVFVGPYEHHSNEISWRQGLATVLEVELNSEGHIDLSHLEELLRDERYLNRLRIGSFSAASNVTGVRTNVKAIAKLLHEHHAYACFDFAASAPYVEINMSGESEDDLSYFDAVFLSPHKFLGGSGSSGVLVFNEKLYHKELAPSVAGGGTVQFVNFHEQDFVNDIEEREKPGTPGVLQTIRAALVMDLKRIIGVDRIEECERSYLKLAFNEWLANDRIGILGPVDVESRISIVSFNLLDSFGKWLHPKLVSKLLNDLFGIQSRAGCSCCGPYAHRLLGIDECNSKTLREQIKAGYHGLKLGWCRIGFHYAHDELEVRYIVKAVSFLATYGEVFASLYTFDIHTGSWKHGTMEQVLSSEKVLDIRSNLKNESSMATPSLLNNDARLRLYEKYLDDAMNLATKLELNKPAPKAVDTDQFVGYMLASGRSEV